MDQSWVEQTSGPEHAPTWTCYCNSKCTSLCRSYSLKLTSFLPFMLAVKGETYGVRFPKKSERYTSLTSNMRFLDRQGIDKGTGAQRGGHDCSEQNQADTRICVILAICASRSKLDLLYMDANGHISAVSSYYQSFFFLKLGSCSLVLAILFPSYFCSCLSISVSQAQRACGIYFIPLVHRTAFNCFASLSSKVKASRHIHFAGC